ncbi:MAG TPA: glycosyltransferase family 2 protein [Polyangia bacterium]
MLILAALALGVLIYTYAGYPVLITLLARLFPMRVAADASYEPSVSVCMTVYNGAAFIERKIDSLLAMDWPSDKLEILVYSDGSSDTTDEIVEAIGLRDPRVKLVRAEERAGKPTGLNRLAELAVGEVLFLTDVRQPVSRNALRAMVSRLADPRVGMVSGNLVLEGKAGSGVYWRYEKFIRRQEGLFRSLVGVSGSITALRKADFEPLPADTVLDDMWIPMRLRLDGRRIVFAPEAEAHDVAFDDDREFSRKVRTLAGNYQILAAMPGLLSPFHNPSWFETVSHKVLRLVCPWALLLLLASAWRAAQSEPSQLARAIGAALLGGQGLFYFAALVGARAGRIGSLARTFVVMNTAAMLGLWRFLAGRQRITW